MKYVFFIVVMLFFLFGFSQEEGIIIHKVEKGETLYKLSVLYGVPIDSLKNWNALDNEDLSIGQEVGVFNINHFDNYKIEANKLRYKVELLSKEIQKNKDLFDTYLKELDNQKKLIDPNSEYATQAYMNISKQKKELNDSLKFVNGNSELLKKVYTEDIQNFEEASAKYQFKLQEQKRIEEEALQVAKDVEEANQNQQTPEDSKPEEITKKPTSNSKETAVNDKADKKEKAPNELEKVQKKGKDKEKDTTAKTKNEKTNKEDQIKESNKEKPEKEDGKIEKNNAKSVNDGIAVEPIDTVKNKDKKKQEKLQKNVDEIDSSNKTAQIQEDKKTKSVKENKETIEKDEDVVIVDVNIAEEPTDTLNKKYAKKQEKLQRKIEAELDSSEMKGTFVVDEVPIIDSKKKKFKIGDEVDATRREKAKFLLARALLEIDKYNFKKAYEYVNKSISLNPSYTEAYLIKGDLMASMKYYDKAIIQYEHATFLDARNPQTFYNMGNCFMILGKKDKAIINFTQSINIDSSYIMAFMGRSAIYSEQKKYIEALADYNKILKLNKYFYPALKGRGIAYSELTQYDNAIRDFNELLEYEKNDPSIYYLRGMAKMYKSMIYEACLDFLSASEQGYAEADKAIKKYCE